MLLALIVCLGAALRVYHLSTVPTELIADELDIYNSVASIVTTGHDVDGTLQPFFYSHFTRNPPVYGIASYASSLVLGKNAFALRFPAVLFGLAAVLLIYGIALRLTRRQDIALAAALLQATQPIFVQFSRIAWEPSSELPFLLGGLYALIIAVQTRWRARWLALAAVLLGIACYTYMAGWFYAALLALGLIALNVRSLGTRADWLKVGGACALWLLISWPALHMVFFDPLTAAKTQRIATFADGITWDALRVFFQNYAAHFRPSYFVISGDPIAGVTWRYLNGFGAFYWFIIPLSAAGLVACVSYVRERGLSAWVYLWLLVYPLGGALTNEGAPTRRARSRVRRCSVCLPRSVSRSSPTGRAVSCGAPCTRRLPLPAWWPPCSFHPFISPRMCTAIRMRGILVRVRCSRRSARIAAVTSVYALPYYPRGTKPTCIRAFISPTCRCKCSTTSTIRSARCPARSSLRIRCTRCMRRG